MIVILRTPFRPSSHVHRKHTLIHAEFPIEQALRSEDAETQRLLMQEPWSRERRPDRVSDAGVAVVRRARHRG